MNLSLKIFNKRYSLLSILGFACACLLVIALFSNFSDWGFEVFFSSDTFYLPSIYRDLFIDGNSLKGWHFNPSPNFFPDMVVYFLLMFFAKNSFFIASFVFAIIQLAVILYFLAKIFHEAMPGFSKNWNALIYLLISLFLLEGLFLTKDFLYAFYLISNSYHTGSFAMSVICFYLTLRYFKEPNNTRFSVLFILILLSIISDRLFIILYSVPVVFASLFMFKKIKRKTNLLFVLTNIIAVFVGLKLFEAIGDSHYIYIDQPHKMLSFEDMRSSSDLFFNQITDYLKTFGFRSLTIYLFLGSFISSIILFFIAIKNKNGMLLFYISFILANAVCVISAPLINGSYTGVDTLRYNLYPFYMAAVNIPVLLACFIKNRQILLAGKSTLLAGVIAGIISCVTLISASGLTNYFNYYPKTTAIIDEAAKKYGLKCGVGNYALAKRNTMFSKNNVKIYAVFDDLSIWDHVTNENWFFKKNEFNFICLELKQDTNAYKKNIEKHETVFMDDMFHIIKTNTFIYDKQKGYLPINSTR